jgi:hypothetical protein
MNSRTARLLQAFDALPEDDNKRVFTEAFLRRAMRFNSGPLDGSETAEAADRPLASLQ